MSSVHGKTINGQTYYYLREVARIDGKPKIVSQRYLGKAEDIAAAMDAAAVLPTRTRHLAFGEVAATWSVLARLDVAGCIDEILGPRRGDAAASVGTYLALAILNRVVAPCSKAGFASWWATTAADRWVKIPAAALDHRRFWDAMDTLDQDTLTAIEARLTARMVTEYGLDLSALALDMTNFATFIDSSNDKDTLDQDTLTAIEARLTARMVTEYGLDLSALALDMTNFATFIDSSNDKAPIAQRGHAKQKRVDLRLVGLGLVVTRDGGIPVLSHAYPGNKPDVTQFPTMIKELAARYTQLRHDTDPPTDPARRPGPRLRADPGQGHPRPDRTGRHAGPRAHPPTQARRAGRDQPSHQGPLGHPRADHRTGRGHPRPAAPDVQHRSRGTPRPGDRGLRHVPLPIRGRVRLPATQGPAHGRVLPDVPLDRLQNPRPPVHLRAGPDRGAPDAPPSRPGRAAPVRC